MSNDDSVSLWIDGLKAGDPAAAEKLWRRYHAQVLAVAREQLGGSPRRVADEEDVALSVFRAVCQAAAADRFPQMSDRYDLWRLLVTVTTRKAIDQRRRLAGQKRGGGRVRGDSAFGADDDGAARGLDQAQGAMAAPDLLAQIDEEHRRLLAALGDDTLRRVATWRMEGYSNDEMAAMLDLTPRSIERKLQRIRDLWSRAIESDA